MPHISEANPTLNTSTGVSVSIEDRIKSVLELDDPVVQMRCFRDLASEITETCSSFSTLVKRNEVLHEALESFFLKTPIVPDSLPDKQAKNLIYGLRLGETLGSALSSAELAGAVQELKKLESNNKNPSDDFINAVAESLHFTIEHHSCSLPMHKSLTPSDYNLPKILSKIGDSKVAEEVYTHIDKKVGIGHFTGSLLRH